MLLQDTSSMPLSLPWDDLVHGLNGVMPAIGSVGEELSRMGSRARRRALVAQHTMRQLVQPEALVPESASLHLKHGGWVWPMHNLPGVALSFCQDLC